MPSTLTPPVPVPAEPVRAHPWHLGFPREIEAQFEADTGLQRSRELVIAGLVALVVFNLFLINDWFSRPEVMPVALSWRLGVVSTYGLIVIGLIHRGLPARWRELLMASTTVVAVWAAGKIFQATTSPAGEYDPFMFSLIFLASNIVFRLRFVAALASSITCFAVTVYFFLQPSVMPLEALPFVLGLLAATAVFTLLARYQLERAERRTYLLMRRESTRREVALQAAGRYATLSQTDALTQLANRRAFDQELPQRWQEAWAQGQPLAALLVDIDHFKRFNDHYGHPAGDACLRQVAQLLRESLRDGDFIARIGGEEFAVLLLLPGSEGSEGNEGSRSATGPAALSAADGLAAAPPAASDVARQVLQMAERMRLHVEQAALPHDGHDGQDVVSISLGVALTGAPHPLAPEALIAAADAALYRAKREGRNRCVMQGDTLLQTPPP